MKDAHPCRGKASVAALVCGAVAALAPVACGSDDDETSAGVVTGTGYEYTLPAGWSDATEAADPAAEELGLGSGAIDSLATVDPEAGFATNVNVAAGPAPPGTTLKLFARVGRQSVESPGTLPPGVAFTSSPTRPIRTELGGRPAVQFDYEGEFQGNAGELRQLMALNQGKAYAVTLASAGSFEDDSDTFQQILASWRWR